MFKPNLSWLETQGMREGFDLKLQLRVPLVIGGHRVINYDHNFPPFCISCEHGELNSANNPKVYSLVYLPMRDYMIVCMYVIKSRIKIDLCIIIQ